MNIPIPSKIGSKMGGAPTNQNGIPKRFSQPQPHAPSPLNFLEANSRANSQKTPKKTHTRPTDRMLPAPSRGSRLIWPSNNLVLRPPTTEAGCLMEGSGLPLKAPRASGPVKKCALLLGEDLRSVRLAGNEWTSWNDPTLTHPTEAAAKPQLKWAAHVFSCRFCVKVYRFTR